MSLSPLQEQVLSAIAAGQTITAAAAEASVHRNTVSNWMHNSIHFREALASAQSYQNTYWREQAEKRAEAAFAALDQILADPKAPASVRARVAMYILNTGSATHEPRKETAYVDSLGSEKTAAAALADLEAISMAPRSRKDSPNLHNFAQGNCPVDPKPQLEQWLAALDKEPRPVPTP